MANVSCHYMNADLDECKTEQHNCTEPHLVCVNVPGSYRCETTTMWSLPTTTTTTTSARTTSSNNDDDDDHSVSLASITNPLPTSAPLFQTVTTTTMMPTVTTKTGTTSMKTATTQSGSSRTFSDDNNEQIASLTSITDQPPTSPSLFQTTTTTLPTTTTAATIETSSETARDDDDRYQSLSTASITDKLTTSSTLSQSTTTTTDQSPTTSNSTSTRSQPVAGNFNTCRPGYEFNRLTSTCEGDQLFSDSHV